MESCTCEDLRPKTFKEIQESLNLDLSLVTDSSSLDPYRPSPDPHGLRVKPPRTSRLVRISYIVIVERKVSYSVSLIVRCIKTRTFIFSRSLATSFVTLRDEIKSRCLIFLLPEVLPFC